MATIHSVHFAPSQNMSVVNSNSVDLIVTSPPYPMIEMWDETMSAQSRAVKDALELKDGARAFEEMHKELDKVWAECYRVLKDGAFLCINIGDATRTIDGSFELYNNHSRIMGACLKLGFKNLPNIIWRKQTNAPNKFMGSGMMPCGAYVTLEHEWILIFRKGGKRLYKKAEEKKIRRESSFFWEERNEWFSDLWEIKGIKQKIENSKGRERSASFPFAIPYRLINMYSQRGDTVLDPFFGLGTTAIAAMASERNSIGFEIDPSLKPTIRGMFGAVNVAEINAIIRDRYDRHLRFVHERISAGKEVKYEDKAISCKVMTKQETDLIFRYVTKMKETSEKPLSYECCYREDVDMDKRPYALFG